MLGDSELNSLDRQLSEFTVATKSRQDALDQLISSYGQLLENYRTLRSDFEEEKESREKYKKLARGQERNPFVLVLVDGDGYIFDDNLIQAGAEGGVRAAGLLNEHVKEKLSRFGREFDDCRIMVRMYTNLAGLSKALARAGLTGNEARSLAPFGANFTRALDLFDFIDAGDKKENADFKIREMFRLFIENGQCKHIFFAGCHDTGYLSMLTPYIGRSDKITLVHGSAFSPEYQNLGLNIDSFHGLFRMSPLEGYDVRRPGLSKPPSTQLGNMPNGYLGSPPPPPTTNAPICTHFLRGTCKFGINCKKSHDTGKNSWRGGDSSWRPNGPNQTSKFGQTSASAPFPPSTAGVASSVATSPSLHSPKVGTAASFPLPANPHVQPSVVLPRPSPETFGLIPLNKDGYRLDFYLQPPSNDSWLAFTARAKIHKLCNEFQLTGYCKNGEGCDFDHNPLSDDLKHVLRSIVHDYPCKRGGNCRQKNCNLGHICYREGCHGSGGKGGCRLNRTMHSIDPTVAEWIAVAVTPTDSSAEAASEEIAGEPDNTETESELQHNEDGARFPPYVETEADTYTDELN